MTPDPKKEITGEFPPDSLLGRQVGAYLLVERVGEGGMGAVYRAVPAGEPEGEPVAVKLIKRGMDTDAVLRRFLNERHILAALEHPNIARLLESGTTEDGLPYVVMEFVAGKPLVRYCDELRLPVAARLELFRKICAAVECAHEKQVIHRDIKPSNILVTAGGEPKLLDFGIAKILDRDLLELSGEVTQTRMPVMTPQYASPEQARGEPVTPASDIYALGVLLYELLTGRLPYRLRTRSTHEIVRAICEQPPERPSAAVTRTRETGEHPPETLATARAGDPAGLRRRIAGDLDAIVLKALAKEPERRYRSAAAMSEDVLRHLEGVHVVARRPGPLYGRRLKVWAFAILCLLLAAGAWAWSRARAVRVRPSVAVMGFENLSRAPAAEWLSTALTEMMSTEMAAGGALRTVSGEQVTQVKHELALPNAPTFAPPTLARLRRSLGADYVVLGSYLTAGEGAAMRVRLDVRLQDTRAGEVLTAVTETQPAGDLMGLVNRTGALLRRRLGAGEMEPEGARSLRGTLPRNPEAARLYSEGLEKLRRFETLAARDKLRQAAKLEPDHALTHAALATVAGLLGYDPEARAEAKRALDLSSNLGREARLFIEGRYYESVRQWDRAEETFRTLHGHYPDNLEYGMRLVAAQWQTGEAQRALATVEELRKLPAARQDPRIDFAEAEAALAGSDLNRARQAAGRAVEAAAAQGLRVLVARSHILESKIFLEMGNPQAAVKSAGKARVLFEAAGNRQGVASAMSEAAGTLTQLGDVAAARTNFADALEICRSTGDQACVGNNLDSIGVLLRRQGDPRGALRMHEQALEARREAGDRGGVAMALYNIGSVRETMGDLAGARAAVTESLDLRRALGLKRSGALTMSRLANVRRKQGELPEALAMARDAVAELRGIGDRGGVAMALYNQALVQLDRGDLAGARAAHQEALAIRRSQRDKNNTAQVLAGLAEVAAAEDKLPDARLFLEESIRLRQELGEKVALAQSKLAMAELAIEEGRAKEAVRLAREAAPEFDRVRAAPGQAEAALALARALVAAGQPGEARRQVQAAAVLLRGSSDCRLAVRAMLTRAQVDAALGRAAEAGRGLEKALSQAGRYGLPGLELEIRLEMARAGRASRAQVASDAARAGYLLVARRAAAK